MCVSELVRSKAKASRDEIAEEFIKVLLPPGQRRKGGGGPLQGHQGHQSLWMWLLGAISSMEKIPPTLTPGQRAAAIGLEVSLTCQPRLLLFHLSHSLQREPWVHPSLFWDCGKSPQNITHLDPEGLQNQETFSMGYKEESVGSHP